MGMDFYFLKDDVKSVPTALTYLNFCLKSYRWQSMNL